jgi:acetyl-CoA acetyltransferase
MDEHPRPKTTLETLAKLPTVFKKNGVVTAASSSGICDGGAALVLASEEAVRLHGLTPLARIVGYATAGVEPSVRVEVEGSVLWMLIAVYRSWALVQSQQLRSFWQLLARLWLTWIR